MATVAVVEPGLPHRQVRLTREVTRAKGILQRFDKGASKNRVDPGRPAKLSTG